MCPKILCSHVGIQYLCGISKQFALFALLVNACLASAKNCVVKRSSKKSSTAKTTGNSKNTGNTNEAALNTPDNSTPGGKSRKKARDDMEKKIKQHHLLLLRRMILHLLTAWKIPVLSMAQRLMWMLLKQLLPLPSPQILPLALAAVALLEATMCKLSPKSQAFQAVIVMRRIPSTPLRTCRRE